MASCAIPLRPRALYTLLKEREIREAMDVYRGNLLWSVLASLHGMAKHELTIPSYGQKLAELRGMENRVEAPRSTLSNRQVVARVQDMFKTFMPKRGEKP